MACDIPLAVCIRVIKNFAVTQLSFLAFILHVQYEIPRTIPYLEVLCADLRYGTPVISAYSYMAPIQFVGFDSSQQVLLASHTPNGEETIFSTRKHWHS